MTKSKNRPKPEKLVKPGLHDIGQTAKVYGATRRAPGQNPVPTAEELAARRKSERLELASSTRVCNGSMRGEPYTCPELSTRPTRAGAMDAYALPSQAFYGTTYLRGQ